ncbi:hypothetical protein DEE91_14130 [Ralstonia pickettii]|uniref:Uncharacterized protein n=2 Tax=Burkholderiaceae TaxID=119060 RepID=A0A192A830_9RALS|nr:hypothetical protein A9Y76_28555 [Ralstonia insidiosa]KMW44140.1 hypothetical protein AC240_26745 [Ralstonia sp. MD27]MBA9884358.1 hypothetical protein [Ralstonia pickettii]MBA9869596.1 hypothetical protein [Ralstonia insidiosa]MBA9894153.1 hypothetical protein [Ralstonia pickettii]
MKKSDSSGQPKPPRRDCKQARIWKMYYEAMARWYEAAADTVAVTFPDSEAVRLAKEDASRFQDGARQISMRTHPNIVSGTWK